MEINKVYVGNNIDILKTFPDNSIDSIVTDPPYGLGKEPNATDLLRDWLDTGYHEVKGKGFMGKEWDAFVPQPIFWKECFRVLKHGGHVLSFAGTRTYDWVVLGLRLAGFEIRDQLAWIYGSGFPKSLDISKAIDKKFGAEREDVNITAPSTDQAKEWQGWGTALKPALEPIVMARKPLDGTVADNVLKHGVGGINIDGCRVGNEVMEAQESGKTSRAYQSEEHTTASGKGQDHIGRFPANVIHDGSDEVVALFPETTSGSGQKSKKTEVDSKNWLWNVKTNQDDSNWNGDSGSAARFFYTAKASQSERNYGLDGFDSDVTTDGRTKPIDNAFNRGETQRKNIHPTVKPIDLMRYLVRLVTPKGGVCLDPFLGSGTTAVAAKAEKFDYIGIELQPEYAEIAQARIKAEIVQYDIFDVMEA